MTRINSSKVCVHRSYTIKELADLLGICEKTALRWLDSGLKTLDENVRPLLIDGSDLKDFLKNRNSKKKVPLKQNQFYCLHCKKARCAKIGSLNKFANKKIALCEVCGTKITRIIKQYQKDYTIPLFPV